MIDQTMNPIAYTISAGAVQHSSAAQQPGPPNRQTRLPPYALLNQPYTLSTSKEKAPASQACPRRSTCSCGPQRQWSRALSGCTSALKETSRLRRRCAWSVQGVHETGKQLSLIMWWTTWYRAKVHNPTGTSCHSLLHFLQHPLQKHLKTWSSAKLHRSAHCHQHLLLLQSNRARTHPFHSSCPCTHPADSGTYTSCKPWMPLSASACGRCGGGRTGCQGAPACPGPQSLWRRRSSRPC